MPSARPIKRHARAFVFIKAKPGSEKRIVEELLKEEQVMEAHIITGEWDLLAVLQLRRDLIGSSTDQIVEYVIDHIERIRGVEDTNTVIGEYSHTKFADTA